VPITVLLYDGPLLCGINVAIKGLKPRRKSGGFTRWCCPYVCLFVCSSVAGNAYYRWRRGLIAWANRVALTLFHYFSPCAFFIFFPSRRASECMKSDFKRQFKDKYRPNLLLRQWTETPLYKSWIILVCRRRRSPFRDDHIASSDINRTRSPLA